MTRCLHVIAEGSSDAAAVGTLLNSAFSHLGLVHWHMRTPHVTNGCGNLTKPDNLNKQVAISVRKTDDAILILVDADRGCAAKIARSVAEAFDSQRHNRPAAVIVAVREIESWVLASAKSVNGLSMGDERTFRWDGDAERAETRDGKHEIRQALQNSYVPRVDLKKLISKIDPVEAERNSPSYAKFLRRLKQLDAAGAQPVVFP